MITQISFYNVDRHSILKRTYKLIFILRISYRCGSHKGYQRVIAKRNCNRHFLIFTLSLFQLHCDIMHSQGLNANSVFIFHLNTVCTYIHLVEIARIFRISSYNRCLGDKETAVLIIDSVKWEDFKQVNIFIHYIFLTWSRVSFYNIGRYREFIPSAVQFKKLFLNRCVFWHAHH